MNQRCLWICLVFFAGFSQASEEPLTAVYSRTLQDLSGTWRFIQDPLDNAIPGDNQVIKAKQRYTFWLDEQQKNPGPLLEYQWDQQAQIQVPGDWNTQKPEWQFYEGTGWYFRQFDHQTEPQQRYLLHFAAANYHTRVFLNGAWVGEHTGGYTPFHFDVSEHLQKGTNTLVVAVNNERRQDAIPAKSSDWWNYGGLTRPVSLIVVPNTYIAQHRLTYLGNNQLQVRVQLAGASVGGVPVSVIADELDLDLNMTTNQSGTAEQVVDLNNPQLWQPSSAKLYEFAIHAGTDRVQDRVGLRTIAVKGTDILLNGQPIFLAGISIHEEPIGPVGGRRVDQGAARALLQQAKDLGANFVRLAHYPHNEWMLRLADEMGLLVWSEIPVYWGISFDDPQMLALAQQMMRTLILRDINRASVVLWGVANETPVNPARNAFLQALIGTVRATDNSRLVSAALLKDKLEDGNTIGISDPLGAHLDVIAVNQYEGWYGQRSLAQIQDIQWQFAFDKPLLFSEFGAGALYGFRSDAQVRWSEDYQAAFYAETLQMVDKIPQLRGMSPWILKDFRSPRRYHGTYQNFWNRKGLISETGQRKQAYFELQRYYLNKLAHGNQ